MIAVIFGGIIFGGIVSAEDADRRWCWPDVIVATGPEAAHAAQHATRSIAIVATADDMVASGLVISANRPPARSNAKAEHLDATLPWFGWA